jgi:hypothetical protein
MDNQHLLQKITIAADSFHELGNTWDLFQKSADYLDNKKHWSLTDWILLAFTSWNMVSSVAKTINDTNEVFKSLTEPPKANQVNSSVYSTSNIYKVLALKNPALGIAFGVSPFNVVQGANPIASLYMK